MNVVISPLEISFNLSLNRLCGTLWKFIQRNTESWRSWPSCLANQICECPFFCNHCLIVMPYIYVFIMCASIYFFWRFSAVFKKSVFFFIFTLALPLKNAYCYFNKGDKQMSYIDSLRFKFLCHSKVKLIDRHKWDIGFAHSDMTRRVNNYHQSANIWGPYRGCVTIEEDSAVYENRRADWSEAYSRKAGTLPSPSFEVIKQTDRRVFIGEERV